MTTITLPRIEYLNLKERAEAFDKMVANINPAFFVLPAEKSRKKIISEFSKTKLYNKAFLRSLNTGLKRSSYFMK
ncbi:hypothetical protein A3H53_04465 [Candidatus Nomurabacteria bacterium RIFCSPLOWO2_02_FULL_40_10]|uniref:Uncharacterized protein n=2 Tax=Candidatus Nomuraibacteriota TaxID=1752729 RepID=A0A1F6XXA3_9BACT|nr:MAG: hypothetical protein A2642_03965 [Candidatus Nomurabacteria bacterium RIFCSPHIGHO2_01_FULL_39_10]OGI98749.1 MAG: hypothetical protein A3H53_04465 [Candidatus Nomurabacteria bacterium RIFCSPLOWO2_02_FULL_40_10]